MWLHDDHDGVDGVILAGNKALRSAKAMNLGDVETAQYAGPNSGSKARLWPGGFKHFKNGLKGLKDSDLWFLALYKFLADSLMNWFCGVYRCRLQKNMGWVGGCLQ